jgi:ribosomal protein L11 methyltransferase
MIRDKVADESVIDLGTGSGILALASLLLGARLAFGIDIEEEALKHAKENAHINQLDGLAFFSKHLPSNVPKENILLMNMIFPEQQTLLQQNFNNFAKLWIVSGILKEQREEYLIQAAQWGWNLISEHLRLGWMGFVFSLEERL